MIKQKLWRILVVTVLIVSIVFCFKYFNSSTEDVIATVNPTENQLQAEINLGKKLFSDKRLSRDETISCLSCHLPEKAFTDGKSKSIGINGLMASRNSPSLYNISDAPYFMHDGGVPTLEMQAIVPIQDLNEMGFSMKELIQRLKSIPEYVAAVKKIYNREVDAWSITRSLAQFEKTLLSKNSRFDLYLLDSIKYPLNPSELAGWKLFSQEFKCIKCHALPNLTSYQFDSNFLTKTTEEDPGRFRITGKEEDRGKYKIPSLRNVTLTAPYMHDGSYSSLKSVIEAYFNAEKSAIRPEKDISEKEIQSMIDFFGTLIDTNSVDLTGFQSH